MHTELAREAIDYTVLPDYRTHYEHVKDSSVNLVSCKHFTTDLLELDHPFELPLDDCGEFMVVMQMKGRSLLKTASGASEINPGECALILTSQEREVQITPLDETSSLLTTHC